MAATASFSRVSVCTPPPSQKRNVVVFGQPQCLLSFPRRANSFKGLNFKSVQLKRRNGLSSKGHDGSFLIRCEATNGRVSSFFLFLSIWVCLIIFWANFVFVDNFF